MANKNDHELSGPANEEGMSRRPRDSGFYGRGELGPDDYASDEEDSRIDTRERYYGSRPPVPPDREGELRRRAAGRREHQSNRGNTRMGEQGNENDWAQQVRQNWQRGPYRDYGWESGESVLPEFRDPGVHMTEEEQEEARNWQRERGAGRGQFRRAYDQQRAGQMPSGQERLQSGGGAGYQRDAWRSPGPFTGRGPKNYQRSSERIMEDINERLTRHGDLDATEIEVKVENGEVWLTGAVESRQAKRLAEDVADSVTGVKDVHNELRIQPQNNPAR